VIGRNNDVELLPGARQEMETDPKQRLLGLDPVQKPQHRGGNAGISHPGDEIGHSAKGAFHGYQPDRTKAGGRQLFRCFVGMMEVSVKSLSVRRRSKGCRASRSDSRPRP